MMHTGHVPINTCSAKVRLHFRGEKLADKDVMSKSDPFLVIYNAPKGVKGNEIGRTETIMNDLNPKWEGHVDLDYFFEQKQEYQIIVYDNDGHKKDADNDELGSAVFQLSQVMGARGHSLRKVMDKEPSCVYITAVEIGANGKDIFHLDLCAGKLKKMDMFGLSDPFFKMFRILPDRSKRLVYQSEVIKKTLDPKWKSIPRLFLEQVTGPDIHAPTVNIELYDQDMFSNDYMGEVTCSVQQLIDSAHGKPIEILKPAKPGKHGYGHFFATTASIEHRPTFAEYLKSGFQINLIVSIDFTGSNGDPRHPRSLHFMDPHKPNQYVNAIMQVGDILMEYDTDKQVPVYGFGALLPQASEVSHFFHVNQQPNPYVHGVQGVLDAYGQCLTSVRLAGPTNFAPTIKSASTGSRQTQGVYTVLLIVTDGEITDMDATIDAIVEADDAPLSIVIVGVGSDCDFEQMTELDGDNKILRMTNGGRSSRRDLVQFVPMRDYLCAPPGALAAEVLREIPDQFVKWAQIAKVAPMAQPIPPQQ